VAGILIYEATDSTFAGSAIRALRDADVPSYIVDTGVATRAPMRGAMIGIYIERPTDADRANKILLGLGAVAEPPLRVAKYEVAVVIAAAAALAILLGIAAALTI
jgi:hypothetical protein